MGWSWLVEDMVKPGCVQEQAAKMSEKCDGLNNWSEKMFRILVASRRRPQQHLWKKDAVISFDAEEMVATYGELD